MPEKHWKHCPTCTCFEGDSESTTDSPVEEFPQGALTFSDQSTQYMLAGWPRLEHANSSSQYPSLSDPVSEFAQSLLPQEPSLPWRRILLPLFRVNDRRPTAEEVGWLIQTPYVFSVGEIFHLSLLQVQTSIRIEQGRAELARTLHSLSRMGFLIPQELDESLGSDPAVRLSRPTAPTRVSWTVLVPGMADSHE